MGILKDQTILLTIETADFELYIKGVPYNFRYESIKQYRTQLSYENEYMDLQIDGEHVRSVSLYDIRTDTLQPFDQGPFLPIFFENGVYQLVIIPKTEKSLEFYHEHSGLREAIGPAGKGNRQLLIGQLDFKNEVGFSTFSIISSGKVALTVTLEIFPSKLSYKKDYEQLLQEVNDEIYNLAFHFIKKTYTFGGIQTSNSPTVSEFYRLLEHFFTSFMNAIRQIENQPHHQLKKEYEWVRADRIRRQDQRTRSHLLKHPHLFVEFPETDGCGNLFLPSKGYTVKKTISFDNHENRFVKWMMIRIIHKLDDLLVRLGQKNSRFPVEENEALMERVRRTRGSLNQTIGNPFWLQIGKLERSVLNLVMQMKVGYRDAYKIYLILMKGITLQGELIKMSLKDVATIYEYWTYLKMGHILQKQYILENQDVVKIRYGALFVRLDESRNSKQVFRHPQTGERIVLSYQENISRLPTAGQKPDILLEIQKKGIDYTYNYVFDAKYRIQFGDDKGENMFAQPGPMEEDINTMHRYRDALVVKSSGPYERHAFGAYVLFPWYDEENYENHPFYKSIGEVNIGGLPFLPNAVKLVERLLDRLVNSNPEELQEEGILPRGSVSYWQSKWDEKVLVLTVNQPEHYLKIKRNRKVGIRLKLLKTGWEQARYLALYITKDVSTKLNVPNGIKYFSQIEEVQVKNDKEKIIVWLTVKPWNMLDHTIKPVGYGIQSNIVTSLTLLKQSVELPELFMKFGEEIKLWKMLRRLTSKVSTILDSEILDKAKKIQAYQIGYYSVDLDTESQEIHVVHNDDILLALPLEKLRTEPAVVFKRLKEEIFTH